MECNHDCFNCEFNDCIKDNELTFEELKQIRREEQELKRQEELEDPNTTYKRKWELRNYERIRENKHRYYEEHREEYKRRQREYYQAHKNEINAKSKEYREQNKDLISARDRERHARQKEEERRCQRTSIQ